MADRDGGGASRVSRLALTIAALVTACAAGGGALFVARPALAPSWWPGRPPLTDLVAAVGSQRTFEPRLTGGFAYAPVVVASTTRSAGTRGGDPLSPELRLAALKLESQSQSSRTAATLGAFGAAALVTGRADTAVAALEEAVRLEPNSAALQSDLAAAFLVRFKEKSDLEDVAKAIGAATTATEENSKLAVARFNLALALEALSLSHEARSAWQAYLQIDALSDWAREALRHATALAPESLAQLHDAERRRIVDASVSGDSGALLAAVRTLPDVAYDHVENELIPEWADAWLTHNRREADALASRARAIGEALVQAVGDRMPLDAVHAIERAADADAPGANSLARAHQAFRDGRVRYQQRDTLGSGARFRDAAAPLRASRSSFSDWTTLELATADYLRNDIVAANRPLDALLESAHVHGYRKLYGRTRRLRGLLRGLSGNLADSLDDYRQALSVFSQIRAREEVAGIHNVIAERLDTLGDHLPAQMHQREALSMLPDVRTGGVRRTILISAADAARRWDLLPAALAIYGEMLHDSQAVPPAELEQGFLGRAATYRLIGRSDLSALDVDAAAASVSRVSDPALAKRLKAEADLVRGEVSLERSASGALAPLEDSRAYFLQAGLIQRLPRIYLAQGRAFAQIGRTDDAEATFRKGTELLEKQRARLPNGELRLSYFDLPWNLYDELIDLLSRQPDRREESLALAERVRARDLLETMDGPDPPIVGPLDLGSRIPNRATVIYYACLRDRVLAWAIGHGRSKFTQTVIPEAELERRIRAFQEAIVSASASDAERLSLELSEILIGPLSREVEASETIVVIPDGVVHLVPFGALKDRSTNRYLIEDHPIVIAPSATVFAHSADSTRTALDDPQVLAIANPSINPEDAPGLRSLEGASAEVHRIADLFPRTTLLEGEAASRSEFIRRAGQFNVVHFGGHALANDRYPWLSRLLFAPDRKDSKGVLFAHELMDISFERTALVVLAACRTGIGPIRKGEGPVSLARPFLARGVPAVIATLWDVDDRATSVVFDAFYRALRSGRAPADALREAQLRLLRDTDRTLSKPSGWAGVVLVGGVRTPKNAETSSGGSK